MHAFLGTLAVASFICNVIAAFGGGGWWFIGGFVLFWVMMLTCIAYGGPNTVSIGNVREIGYEVERAVSAAIRAERKCRD